MSNIPKTRVSGVVIYIDLTDQLRAISTLGLSTGWIDEVATEIGALGICDEITLDGHQNFVEIRLEEYDSDYIQDVQSQLNTLLEKVYKKFARRKKK